MNNKVIFLDYDGVVNTRWWSQDEDGTYSCRYNYPSDKSVNNTQAVQWVSEFCEKYRYDIILTTSWREDFHLAKECLINGGLRKGIEILGMTPELNKGCRGDEIEAFLLLHPDINHFLIFDDEDDMGKYKDLLVQCLHDGFLENEFNKARTLHLAFNNN